MSRLRIQLSPITILPESHAIGGEVDAGDWRAGTSADRDPDPGAAI